MAFNVANGAFPTGPLQAEHPVPALSKFVAGQILPFETQPAKVPYFPPPSGTTQVRGLARGTFVTGGSSDFGFIALAPTYASDITAVYASESTFTANEIETTSTGVGQYVLAGNPYTAGYFEAGSNQNQSSTRVIPRWGRCAFRIQNITPADSRGGWGYMGCLNAGMADCNHINEKSYMALKSQGAVQDVDVNGEWNEFTLLPCNDEDFKFQDTPFPLPKFSMAPNWDTAGDDDVEYRPVLPAFAIIKAPSGTPQTYNWEMIFDWDYLYPGLDAGSELQQQTIMPTPAPAHHPGVAHLAQALWIARQGAATAKKTAHGARKIGAKIGHFFKSVGHFIGHNPVEDVIGGGLGALGVGGATADSIGSALSFAFL